MVTGSDWHWHTKGNANTWPPEEPTTRTNLYWQCQLIFTATEGFRDASHPSAWANHNKYTVKSDSWPLLPKVGFWDANYTSALLPKVGFWDANYTSAWANHNKHTVKSASWSLLFLGIKRLSGYSSSFSRTGVIVMFWLAEVLGDWQPQTACNADNMTSRQCSGEISTCVWV